jgi:predicted tellurium resistance membrane protein TerC
MDRFPIIITIGGMLLGWIAGTMAVTDPAALPYLPTVAAAKAGALPEVVASLRYGAGVAGALLVLALGMMVRSRSKAKSQSAA